MARLFAVLESPVLTGDRGELAGRRRRRVLAAARPRPLSRRAGRRSARASTARRLPRWRSPASGGNEPWSVRLPIARRPRERRRRRALGRAQGPRAASTRCTTGADPEEVRAQIVALGLEHHLVTPHTSLVAVDVTPVAARGRGAAVRRRAHEPAARLELRAAVAASCRRRRRRRRCTRRSRSWRWCWPPSARRGAGAAPKPRRWPRDGDPR